MTNSIKDQNRTSDVRAVECLDQFFHAGMENSTVLVHERAVVGDFGSLARWFNDNAALIERKFRLKAEAEYNVFSKSELVSLKDDMGGGEKYAADRIIDDMNAIEKRLGPSDGDKPRVKLVVLNNHEAAGQMSLIECFYTAFAMDGVRPGSLLRKANENVSLPAATQAASQPSLVLKAS